jgi:acyl-CoA reductase-like NAD-dependent aldehyde dehydrogenase
MSSNHLKFYINGAWVDPVKPATIDVINPATEEAYTKISAGSAADVDKAVTAARAAFESFSRTSKAERVALLKKIIAVYEKRAEDIAQAVSTEMGAPIAMARHSQGARSDGVRGAARQHADRARRYRRGRPDHALELAVEPDLLQGRPGHRRRLHHDPETQRDRADHRHYLLRSDA